ncbi:GNAT family N-acetyltransferase [Rhizobium halophytocola]|uniref:Ribosomal protein S18 acetylase RimI-like enzyme n=1 Tax=Rhizobium halophytocola TaxID=735519 RepID=A0ABS4DXZ8_9HYPH|nr:GNAT family N-acetyltransferase [Rhizobium halophytocola]MBP1850569.1 ribosomal protein S18 acetylase RimI-like enzyme [Rhizobium halophytocola]
MFFVRTAMEGDVKAVRDLLVDTFEATYLPFYGAETVRKMLEGWHSLPAIKARVSKKDAEFLVADDGKRIGGTGYAAMYPKMAKTAMLHQLYVHPSCQGEGVGRDIFAELETCFPDAEIMRVEVAVENVRAISFYERLGFVEVDRMVDCGGPGSGLPAVLMEKRLEL